MPLCSPLVFSKKTPDAKMKKYFIIPLLLILTGCLNTPVERHFPEVPSDLLNACPDLKSVDPKTTKLSEVVSVVTANYGQYEECQVKVDAWIEWYEVQKQIFENLK
mgnify:CR=1 FL=1